MQIESIRVRNYKGFADSGPVRFGTGFNVLIGQNNSGKSALLEALRLTGNQSSPHRSIRYERGAPLPPNSEFDVTYSLTGSQLKRSIIASREVYIPIPFNARDSIESYIQSLIDLDRIFVTFTATASGSVTATSYPSYSFPDMQRASRFDSLSAKIVASADFQDIRPPSLFSNQNDTLYNAVYHSALYDTYVFDAQRLNIGKHPAREETKLDPSASNLPAVLANLQSNPSRYRRFCAHVTEVLPNVKWVSVPTVGNEFEIKIWPVHSETERDDIATGILQGGTGVGQILAILYVAMTMENAIIGIDEPNNFLHPGAVKKLIGILNTYSTNQYIISTHSTEAILAADPSTINLIKWDGDKSIVDKVAISDAHTIRATLSEIGSSLSDLFGPDAIIWVEGETEQFCFPEICRVALGGVPTGLSFLALRSTSDVEQGNRNANKALALYERISSVGAIVPPVLAFSFDRELRSKQDVDDLRRRPQRTLVLDRRTVENYLMSAKALAHVISSETAQPIEPSAVEQWLRSNRSSFCPPTGKRWEGDTWEHFVDAPRLISAAFHHFSDSALDFRKTRHSLMLLSWCLENEPGQILGLVDYVKNLIQAD